MTLHDVATEAGVSVATVSRALNGGSRGGVRPESELAVRKAARKLGYRPNRAARSLRLRQTEMLGIVVPHIANPFFAGVVQAVERALQATNWDLLIADAQDDPDREYSRLQALAERQVDGVIVIPCEGERSAHALAALEGVPIVQVDRRVERLSSDWIGINSRLGIQAAVEHLLTTGRKRFAFVGGSADSIVGRERLEGYREVLVDKPASSARSLLGDFTLEWGEAAAVDLLAEDGLPDAIVCGNDLIALGVMRAIRERGIDVPRDVAITGFDDIAFASLGDPALTTVRQPIGQIGARAVDLLRHRIADRDAPFQEVRLAPQLIVRASSGRRPDVSTSEDRGYGS